MQDEKEFSHSPRCEVKAQLASRQSHGGSNAAGLGVVRKQSLKVDEHTRGVDAMSHKKGALNLMFSTDGEPENYALYVRMPLNGA